MTKKMENRSVAKQSTNTLTPAGATSVQVIHQIIIPETPVGLIGEKVVYNEKYLKRCKNSKPLVPLPECGYFTITGAVLQSDGRVMVTLYPYSPGITCFMDGTNICAGYMKKYESHA
jgi:hypothetical protein